MIEACLLGTGGMMPLPGRWLSSLAVRSGGQGVLFDCGEGTQIALRASSWGFRALDAICISHLHADHVGGIVGILFTLANSGRQEPVDIYGPSGLTHILHGQRLLAPSLPFEVRSHELRSGEGFRVGDLRGSCLEADHHLPCLAYRLDLDRRPRFDAERALALGLPQELWEPLQNGEPVQHSGRLVKPEEVLGPPRRGLCLAYITDTRPLPTLAAFAAGTDLLVCEATFGDPEDAARAVETKHMTFEEAAGLARQAGSRRLWLTHFSPALAHPEEYHDLASAIFPGTVLGVDGMRATLRFDP